jgi:hypothetical protein
MSAWLQQKLRRFMRPDAGRYLRPDHARYVSLQRKWDGQPRIEAGDIDGGQFTYGLQYEGTSYGGDQPVVYISTPPDQEQVPEYGIGHNSSSFDDPPNIPQTMPNTREARMGFVRAAASWLFGRSAIAVSVYFGLLDQVDRISSLTDMIKTANDPPSSLEDLQRRAQNPSERGYANHHIVNQHNANRNKFGDARIDAPANVVRIPQLKHIELSRWYATKNPKFGGRSPQQALRDMNWEEQTRIGLDALKDLGIVK